MGRVIKKIFVNGFPGFYGGAGTELHHQIIVWRMMGMDVHLIPTGTWFQSEDMMLEMLRLGVVVHAPNDWSVIERGDPVMGFCNADFLSNLPEIGQRTGRTVFINCMTWLFEKEKECMARGDIAMFLYQNEEVRQKNKPLLQKLNDDPSIAFLTFRPYFHNEAFPYVTDREDLFFGCGRISRQDADKYAKYTLHVYEYFVSPVEKRGLFLGFGQRSLEKTGPPFAWIRTAPDQNEISQQEFYRHCKIVLQPTETTENWPRVGFEAMSSGSVLIVDNRGGWRQMVEHGRTGWLCDHPRDFIYYASKMAYEPHLREEMAEAARIRGVELGGLPASMASWEEVFEAMSRLPE